MPAHYYFFQPLKISSADFKKKALVWANRFRLVAFYENNQIAYPYQGFDNLLAVSDKPQVLVSSANAFENLDQVIKNASSLLCGFLTYDLKNQVENLRSSHPDYLGFPLLFFFQPEIFLNLDDNGFELNFSTGSPEVILQEILTIEIKAAPLPLIPVKQRVSKADYLKNVQAIQAHILEGDVYELNYCVEFYSPVAVIDPVNTFWALQTASPMPFAGFFKLEEKYLLCASPERSLKKEGQKLISQPIKGTAKRHPEKNVDDALREGLKNSEKETAENMMIMDLVRNDLGKSSLFGSVQVEEMFGIYGFRNLYQMITTVTSQKKTACSIAECIKNAFPMGSMTGAPKIRAMELIENYERTKRGLFSGSLGYIKPNGDFDFNVVIRSLQYNAQTGYLSFMVGSAITYDSVAEEEYAECLLKAETILNILKK